MTDREDENGVAHAEIVDGRLEITDLGDVDNFPGIPLNAKVELSMKIIRADGTVEDLGVVPATTYVSGGPFRRMIRNIIGGTTEKEGN